MINNHCKILLINPPDVFSSVFPFGLSAIVSSLLEERFDLQLLDFVNKKSSDRSLQETVLNNIDRSGIKLVCLTGLAHNYPWLKELSLNIKARFSNIIIIGGGHWAYHEPEIVLNNTGVDVVVNGEGDYIIKELVPALLNKLCLNKIKGITYKDESRIISTGPAPDISDLDKLPLPAYGYFDMNSYILIDKDNNHRELALQTGRGCIGKCMFCTGEEQMFRKHSVPYVIEHIKYVIAKYGINRIKFKEALTLGNRSWTKDFCRLLISENIRISYECVSRVDTVDEEIIKLLKESGCYQIQFGMETGDDRMLSEIAQKMTTVKKAETAISLCHKYDIVPRGGFIIGLPGETIGSLNATLRFIWKTRTESTGVNFPTPFPGTRLFGLAAQRFNRTKADLFDDMLIMNYNEELQDQLLNKYNFTDLHPSLLRLYRFLFHELFLLNSCLRQRKYARFILEVGFLFHLKVCLKLLQRLSAMTKGDRSSKIGIGTT